MSRMGLWMAGLLLPLLWAGGTPAGADQLFPASEVREAHQLRQRMLDGVPGLDLAQLREPGKAGPERLAEWRAALTGLAAREAANPFAHWALGEVLRQLREAEASLPAFERAARAAEGRPVVHWILWQEFLVRGLLKEADRHGDPLALHQLRLGLQRAPLSTETLIRAARSAQDLGEPERAVGLYDRALALDPDLSQALAGRASAGWETSRFRIGGAVRDLAGSLTRALADHRAGGRLSANWLESLLIAWLACLVVAALFAVVRSHDRFLHDLGEGPLQRYGPRARRSLALLCLLVPFVLGLGILWTAVGALLLLAPYLTRRDRLLVSLLLVGVGLMPFGYRWVASRHLLEAAKPLALGRAAERGGRGEGLVKSLAQWRAAAPDSGVAAYYLGLVQKRRGELSAAEGTFREAARLRPEWSPPQTSLGNVLFQTRRVEEARASYTRALNLQITFASAANLGAVYAHQVEVEKAGSILAESLRLDPFMATVLAKAAASGGPPALLDEVVPGGVLAAEVAVPSSRVAEVAEGFWGGPLRGIGLAWLPGTAAVLLALLWVHAGLRGGRVARPCQECGTAFCARCQTDLKERSYCPPCTPVYRSREGVPAVVKLARFREADGWSRSEAQRAGWWGTVLPGGAWWYRGGFLGLPICLGVLWILLEGALLEGLTPSLRFAAEVDSSLRWVAAAGGALGLHGLAAWWGWRAGVRQPREDRMQLLRGDGGGSGREGRGYEGVGVRG